MKNTGTFLLLCSLMLQAGRFGHAETPSEQALMQALVQDNIHPVWLTQKWDDKANKPYVAKAREVETLLQKKVAPALLLKKYEATALKKPKDSLAVFPWVYARYRLVELRRVSRPLPPVCEDLYKVLAVAPSPPSAEYARLRFKVESQTHLNARLLNIGPKLVGRYKNDAQLAWSYNCVVSNSGSLEAAVRNDYQLIKKYPNVPRYRFDLGSDLTSLSWQKRDPKLLDAGEKQFDLYEKIAPSNDPLRHHLPGEREYIRLKRLRFAGKTP